MPSLVVILDGDSAWPDLKGNPNFIDAMGNETKVSVAPLAHGMASGKTSVTFRIDAPNGQIICFETSLALLKTAVETFVKIYGE